jgi:hypothetical protein
MPLTKRSPALRLQCLAVLLAAQAASAESPPVVLRIYPEFSGAVPPNTVIIAHAHRGYQLDPSKVVLRDPLGDEVPSTITPEADERGGVMVKPSAPLSANSYYLLHTGLGVERLDVLGEPDTTPPSAIIGPTVTVAFSSDDRVEDVSLGFPAPTDNTLPRSEVGYDVWVSQAPNEPDLNAKPTLMGTKGRLLRDEMHVSLAPGQFCVAALPSKSSGRFIVRLRARDAAGNLGPASEPIEVQVDKVPECLAPGENTDKGCSAVPALAPAAWVAVALWLSRRRR